MLQLEDELLVQGSVVVSGTKEAHGVAAQQQHGPSKGGYVRIVRDKIRRLDLLLRVQVT
jgi:hypothetical protein